MARRRFFVKEVRRGIAELTGTDAEHLSRVLRVEAGQHFELSDNLNIYLAEVETARKSLISFKIVETLSAKPETVHITLLAALFKFDHFEWMLEKTTELGVSKIQPVEATRTERGLMQASVKRLGRWERIVLEASQQSRRDHLPHVEQTIHFRKSLETPAAIRLLLDEASDAPPILRCLAAAQTNAASVALLLGPEGGWTDEEREKALRLGWQPCSLGATILRAETAAMAALAVVSAWATTGLTPHAAQPEPVPV